MASGTKTITTTTRRSKGRNNWIIKGKEDGGRHTLASWSLWIAPPLLHADPSCPLANGRHNKARITDGGRVMAEVMVAGGKRGGKGSACRFWEGVRRWTLGRWVSRGLVRVDWNRNSQVGRRKVVLLPEDRQGNMINGSLIYTVFGWKNARKTVKYIQLYTSKTV